MDTIEFSSGDGKVEIGWSFDGDYLVEVAAAVHGFRGAAAGHVALDDFRTFATDIVALADSRKGEARFASVAPGILDVTVRSIDGTGHIGVFGSVSAEFGTRFDESQQLRFTLHFEPSQIEDAARAMRDLVG